MSEKGLVGTAWGAGGVLCKVRCGERAVTTFKLAEVFLLNGCRPWYTCDTSPS